MAMMSGDVAGDLTLIEETEDPGSTQTPGDVVEGEEAAVEIEGVDPAVTEEETQQIETEGAATEAALEEEVAEEEVAEEEEVVEEEEESTTSSFAGVQAQGEVRDTGINASPDETVDEPDETQPTETETNATPEPESDENNQARTRTTPNRSSGVSSRDSGGATAAGRVAASPPR
jgi:hypothetical protein